VPLHISVNPFCTLSVVSQIKSRFGYELDRGFTLSGPDGIRGISKEIRQTGYGPETVVGNLEDLRSQAHIMF
jgi:hypothetical protein